MTDAICTEKDCFVKHVGSEDKERCELCKRNKLNAKIKSCLEDKYMTCLQRNGY